MKKTIILLMAGLLLALSSCKEDQYFALERPNQYPWQSASELEMAVRAPYLYYVGAAWSNPIGALTNRFGESDLAQFTGKTGDSYYYAYWDRLWETLVLENAKELEGGFEYLYYAVTACNAPLQMILAAEKENKDPFVDMSDSDRALVKRIKGELLFMRAFSYWNLARTWCPPYDSNGSNATKHFVLYKEYVNDSNALKNSELASVKEVYDAIVTDLKDAIAVLPESYYTGDNGQRMRVNKYAAEALLARVYFSMGMFGEAKTLIDDVIKQTSLYDLSEDPYQAFNKISGQGSGKEVIFEIVYSGDSNRYDRNPGIMNFAAYNGHPTKQCGYCAFAMSYAAMEKVGWMNAAHEVTPEALADKRYVQLYKYSKTSSYGDKPYIFLYKYFRANDVNSTNSGERRANRPMIRLADLYLMRAEINWLNNSKKDAAADVNVVRQRAGLAPISESALTENDIENERIKEMAGENADRIFWLTALHKDIPIGDRDPAKFSPIKYPYSKYYYQIPLQEQQTNNAYKTKAE